MKLKLFATAPLALAIALFSTALADAQMYPSAPVSAPALPDAVKINAAGSLLTDGNGMTLYVYDNDTAGKSVCNGACAQNWPPLAAAADAQPVGAYTLVTRDDGTKQWAYNGKPLYRWKNDKAPGDTTGDGVLGKWHTAKP